MMRLLEKVSRLTELKIKEIQQLANICSDADHYNTKLYWNIMGDRATDNFDDYLYYVNGKLVGYFAIFHFSEFEAELCSLVHPEHRNQGNFKMLWEEAKIELRSRNIKSGQFLCNKNAFPALQCLQSLGTTYSFSEYRMECSKPLENYKARDNFTIREANIDDTMPLAKIETATFDCTFDISIERIVDTIHSPKRKIWLGEEDGRIVGKIHYRDDNSEAFIHDFCIDPELQGKGYGTALLQYAMVKLFKEEFQNIVLEVTTDNADALKVYEKNGFEVIEAHDYWKYDLTPPIETGEGAFH